MVKQSTKQITGEKFAISTAVINNLPKQTLRHLNDIFNTKYFKQDDS